MVSGKGKGKGAVGGSTRGRGRGRGNAGFSGGGRGRVGAKRGHEGMKEETKSSPIMATAYDGGQPSPMWSLSSKLRPFLLSPSKRSHSFSALPATKAIDTALMKEKWLDSLSLNKSTRETTESSWVLGIDPDLSGALALLKTDHIAGSQAQVFDTPHLPVLVGKRVRKRLDAKSIVQLIQSLDLPSGSRAYIEQSNPFPKDGKQGWYSGGFGYGLWIGTLVASGFSVVPVPASLWKRHFQLAGGSCAKDDSRRVASEMFPSLSLQLKRKKDHGRAEALLIAAYGEALKPVELLNPPPQELELVSHVNFLEN